MTTVLQPTPNEIISLDGTPRFGTYAGPLTPVSFTGLRDPRARSVLYRNSHLKKWIYCSMMSPDFIVSVAIVHLRYAATAFLNVFDRKAHRCLFDKSWFTPGLFASVSDACEQGCDASFRAPGVQIKLLRPHGKSHYDLTVEAGDTILHACFDTANGPPPIAVVAPVADGVVNVTQKRVLLEVEASLVIDDRTMPLDNCLGGFDYTQGLLAHHTSWRWAFAQGHCKSGKRIGLNLVDGFNQERECALWLDSELIPIAAPRFIFDSSDLMAPWQIKSDDGLLDLVFTPETRHMEKMNLGILRSNFVQPIGSFAGSIAIPGRDKESVDTLAGVVESQDVLW